MGNQSPIWNVARMYLMNKMDILKRKIRKEVNRRPTLGNFMRDGFNQLRPIIDLANGKLRRERAQSTRNKRSNPV